MQAQKGQETCTKSHIERDRAVTGAGKKDTLSSRFDCQPPEQKGGAEIATVSRRVLEYPSLSIGLAMLVLDTTSFSVGFHRVSLGAGRGRTSYTARFCWQSGRKVKARIFPGTFSCAYRTQGA